LRNIFCKHLKIKIMKKENYFKLLLVSMMIFATTALWAGDVTVKVVASDGITPVSGVQITYGSGTNSGAAYFPGTPTPAGGSLTATLPSGTYSFRASFRNGSSIVLSVDCTGATAEVTFQTAKVILELRKCNGDPLSGGSARYGAGAAYGTSFWPGGNTDAFGQTTTELFPGTYSIEMGYQSTAQVKSSISIAAGTNTFTWNTTNVTLVWPYDIAYGGSGDSRFFNKPSMELLAGTYNFNFRSPFGNKYKALTISGCTFGGVINVIKVLDHNGIPIAGATARGGVGAAYGTWHVAGSTDANGLLMDIRPLPASGTGYSYEAKVNSTTAVIGPLTTNFYLFNTQLLTLRLETCDGTPIDGGHVRWGHGAVYGSSHFIGGNTGTSASGETSAEMFPGTYSFEMGLYGTTNVKSLWDFPTDGATLTWQTTNVTLHYSGAISFGGGTGDSRWFNKPSMELMPGGTYTFHFRGGERADLTIESVCDMEKYCAVVKMRNSLGDPIAAVPVKYRYGYGTKVALDDTNGNGNTMYISDNPNTTVKYTVSYKDASLEKVQNIITNSIVEFNTVKVTADLEDSDSNSLTTDSWQYRIGYGSYFALDETGEELLPVHVKVKVGYKGAIDEKQQNVGVASHFDFNTVKVTADLEDSGGVPLTADSWQYRIGYGSYSSLNNLGEELLPVHVKVKVDYKGATVEKQQNVGVASHFDFNTVKVTADLEDSGGVPLTADSWQYRIGYGSYFTLDNSGEELLPVSVKVKATYSGDSKEKIQNVGTAPHFDFEWDGADLKSAIISDENIPDVKNFSLNAYPNPFSDRVRFEFASPDDTYARIIIYDATGRMVKTVFDKPVKGGVNYTVEFVPETQISSLYLYRMTIGKGEFNGKLIYKK
jgi:hypothetical protein